MRRGERLLPEFLGFVRLLDGDIRLDREEVVEGAALLVGELAAEAIGVHHGLTLGLRHLAEIAEGSADETTAVLRKAAELLHSSAKLLALSDAHISDGFVALEEAAALLGRHAVELCETVAEALLGLGGKIMKARFALKRFLLLGERHLAVARHPLGQMLLILSRVS
jgi:hypothetical protein